MELGRALDEADGQQMTDGRNKILFEWKQREETKRYKG